MTKELIIQPAKMIAVHWVRQRLGFPEQVRQGPENLHGPRGLTERSIRSTYQHGWFYILLIYARRFLVTLFVFSAKWPLERGQLRKT